MCKRSGKISTCPSGWDLFIFFILGLLFSYVLCLWTMYTSIYLPVASSLDSDHGPSTKVGGPAHDKKNVNRLGGGGGKWGEHTVSGISTGFVNPNFVAVVTTDFPERNVRVRAKEYALGLEHVFYTFERVYTVVRSPPSRGSLMNKVWVYKRWGFLDTYPFERLPTYFTTQYSKQSAQESDGLRVLSRSMQGTGQMRDSDVVFKVSGYHQIVRRDFVLKVLENPDFDVWAKALGNDKIVTHFWAMRWNHFKVLYSSIDFKKLDSSGGPLGYDMDTYAMEYIKGKGLRLFNASVLHILSNVTAPDVPRGVLVYY